MHKLSKIFKVLARIVGVLCLFYGFFIGICGIGPDGRVDNVIYSLIGIYVLPIGWLYLLPNHKFTDNSTIAKTYLFIIVSPILFLTVAAAYSIIDDGWNSFAISGGLVSVITYTILALFAPISITLEYLEKSANKSLERTE